MRPSQSLSLAFQILNVEQGIGTSYVPHAHELHHSQGLVVPTMLAELVNDAQEIVGVGKTGGFWVVSSSRCCVVRLL